ncbi:TetR/AcrR family transcriptional regulator [Nocardioidaceae bacterium]|nr:TetR/AcrR family transcriptional regulator [Nocardioidaceae bacterium]
MTVKPHLGTRGMPRAERESEILTAALAEFAERGYHQVTMASVAARAGVSKPLVHAYFGTKDSLYIRCVDDVAEEILEAVTPVVDREEPGLAMALETMRTVFGTLEGLPGRWMVVYDPRIPADSEAGLAVDKARRRLTELGATGVRALLHARGNHDELDVSGMNALWQAVVTAQVQWWLDHPEQTPEQLTDRFGRLLVALTP